MDELNELFVPYYVYQCCNSAPVDGYYENEIVNFVELINFVLPVFRTNIRF